MGLFLVLVQFLQAVLGYTAVRAAVGLLPMIAVMMPLSAVATTLSERFGLRVMLTAGNIGVAAGLAMMALFASADGGYWPVLPGILLLGVGMGLSMSPGTTAITASLPEEKQGVASALNDTVREFGGAIGIALIGSILSAGYASGVESATTGLPAEAAAIVKDGIGGAYALAPSLGAQGPAVLASARTAFVDGWKLSMWISAALAIVTASITAVWIPRHRRQAATLDEMTTIDRRPLVAVD
jgi:Na+/melibiose symporter-like transporter